MKVDTTKSKILIIAENNYDEKIIRRAMAHPDLGLTKVLSPKRLRLAIIIEPKKPESQYP